MNCHHCTRDVKLWQTFCPYCGSRQLNKSFSTIAEEPIILEPQSSRQLLRKTMQFVLVALAVIVLASVFRLSPPQANPVVKEAAKPNAASSPASLPTPEPTLVAAPVVPVPKPTVQPEAKLPPIDLMADVFEIRGAAKVATPKLRNAAMAVRQTEPNLPVADEARPKKAIKPPIVSEPNLLEAKPILPRPVEAEANLEVDTTKTLLQPNIGLLSIKSYVPARVYIDGVYSGVTPRSVKLLAGDHSISLMANGYHEYSRTIKVAGQQQIGILASLSKK